MVTTLRNQQRGSAAPGKSPAASPRRVRGMSPDFRLLGLRPREARVDIIRQAMHEAAERVTAAGKAEQDGEQLADEDHQLALIATAGYHLLDPRRRNSLFERVQLLLWSEEDLDMELAARWDLAHQPPKPRVVATPISQQASASPIETESPSSRDETQVALEVFRSIRKQDRKATAVWVSIIGIVLSLALALTIFALAF